jgi:hypothetical protein
MPGTHPLVFAVLRRTVAKVDSIGFEVRICCQWAAGKSQDVFFGTITPELHREGKNKRKAG